MRVDYHSNLITFALIVFLCTSFADSSTEQAGWRTESRAGWLNEMLYRFWPEIGRHIQHRIAKPLELGIREKLEERNFRDFTVQDIKIGNRPVRVEQFKVAQDANVTDGRNASTVVDYMVNYDGDCTVWFSVFYSRGILPLPTTKAVMEGLKGILRVIIRHPPDDDLSRLFGGELEVYFVQTPKFDFEVSGINYFMAPFVLPVKMVVRDYIVERIESTVVYPNKIVILP